MDEFEALKNIVDIDVDIYMTQKFTWPMKMDNILATTDNPYIIDYIFSKLKYCGNIYHMLSLSKNTNLKKINITHVYFYLYNMYFMDDNMNMYHYIKMIKIIINNIIKFANCNVNYKLLTIIFKIFNNLLSNDIENKHIEYCVKNIKKKTITTNYCFLETNEYRRFKLIVYVEYFIPDNNNIDIYFNIGTKSIINIYIIQLLDNTLDCNIYKCLQVLLNHDPNLHIFYFIKIFQMKSIASIDLIDLLLTYDIDDILNTQLDLLLDLQNTNTYLDILDRDNNTLLFKFEKLNNGRLEYILK